MLIARNLDLIDGLIMVNFLINFFPQCLIKGFPEPIVKERNLSANGFEHLLINIRPWQLLCIPKSIIYSHGQNKIHFSMCR